MTPIVVALLVAPLQYSFEPGTKLAFDSRIEFEGFIPILGGNEGTVVVELGVTVEGLASTKKGTVRAANEISQFRITFNGEPLPLDVSSVQTYFPRTTISLERNGRIVQSDAPDIRLPVRLPGLDVKRFPDITYVPIEFPKDLPEKGEAWTFAKKFGESEIAYTCTLTEQRGDVALIKVSIRQEFEQLENAALEVVSNETDAERRVKTVMTGSGVVTFNVKRGVVLKAEMVNDAQSDVTKLADGSSSKRILRTTFSLSLKEEKPGETKAEDGTWFGSAWNALSATAARLAASTVAWWTLARLAFRAALSDRSGSGG